MKARRILARHFKRGTLREALVARTRQARDSGALQPIRTEQVVVEDSGVRFVVRVCSSLARKDRAGAGRSLGRSAGGHPRNPFLPYDPSLWVADLSDTHVGLLNKFLVVENHLLIVTRRFEDQETLLTRADFEALWLCLAELEGLGFYNGGSAAGASQPHKHLQVVPLPLSPGGSELPIAPLLEPAPRPGRIGHIAAFPVRHAVVGLGRASPGRGLGGAKTAHAHYRRLLEASGLPCRHDLRQPGPYNLLVSPEWMLLVPRSKECFHNISVNALGFAGSLFVRNPEEMRLIQRHGPWKILSEVGVAVSGP